MFDCANPCGRTGKRYLSVREPHPHDGGGAAVHHRRDLEDHQHAQRFDSVEDCKDAYMLSWRLGLKANALYRDGSKLSQPLNSQLVESDDEEEDAVEALLALERRRSAPRSSRRADRRARGRAGRAPARARASAQPPQELHRRRRSSAATRSICTPANMRTGGSAKFSSTCTRRAPPSAHS